MARRPNYDHVKRQKELDRQKKQEAKLEAKQEKKRLRRLEEEGAVDAEHGEDGGTEAVDADD